MSLLTPNDKDKVPNIKMNPKKPSKVSVARDYAFVVQSGAWNKNPSLKRGVGGIRVHADTGLPYLGEDGTPKIDTPYKTKGDNTHNMRKSDKELRMLILCNFFDIARSVMLTINPLHRTCDDWWLRQKVNKLMKQIASRYLNQYGAMAYVSVLELNEDLQGFHCHIPVAFNNAPGRVELDLRWLQGVFFDGDIHVRRITSALGLAGYLTPHRIKRFNDVDGRLMRRSPSLEVEEVTMYFDATFEDRAKKMHEKAVRNEQIPSKVRRYSPSQGLAKATEWIDIWERTEEWLRERGYCIEEESYAHIPEHVANAIGLPKEDALVRYATYARQPKARGP